MTRQRQVGNWAGTRDRRQFKAHFGGSYPGMDHVFPAPPQDVWDEIRGGTPVATKRWCGHCNEDAVATCVRKGCHALLCPRHADPHEHARAHPEFRAQTTLAEFIHELERTDDLGAALEDRMLAGVPGLVWHGALYIEERSDGSLELVLGNAGWHGGLWQLASRLYDFAQREGYLEEDIRW